MGIVLNFFDKRVFYKGKRLIFIIDKERLVELLKRADKTAFNASDKLIMNYDDLIDSDADFLMSNGIVVLPCNKGDELYVLTSDSPLGYEKVKCKRITIVYTEDVPCAKIYASSVYDDWEVATWVFYSEAFGSKVFLTRGEAEKALNNQKQG